MRVIKTATKLLVAAALAITTSASEQDVIVISDVENRHLISSLESEYKIRSVLEAIDGLTPEEHRELRWRWSGGGE